MTSSRPGDIFQPGDLLNNTYRIETVLGRGGTSEVYKARNEVSDRFVAIKALKSEFAGDEGFLTLMRREEEIREIRHDAVVRYSENHRTPDGHIYLVMDYVEGPALEAIMKGGGMSATDLLAVCKRVAEGLRVAHNRNIVHRDLSPDNIIVRGGTPSEAVIIDFGIAKDTNPGAQTIVGNEFAGKYAYAAPEQLSGQTDPRTDIYSLGALLLATFRGAKPDIGNNPMEVIRRKAEPLDTQGVPEPLKTLLDRMTAPDPARRFASADALLAALDAATGGASAEDLDGTMIVPRAASSSGQAQTVPPKTVPPAAVRPVVTGTLAAAPAAAVPAPAASASRSRVMVPMAVVVLVAAIGAGGYFGGVFDTMLGPRYPVADPYALVIERPADGPVTAVGVAPSEEAAAGIAAQVGGMGGSADLTLASGDIAESWAADVQATLAILAPVQEWRLSLRGNDAQITGTTDDPALRREVLAAFADDLPGALTGTVTLQQGPIILAPQALAALLTGAADCGPLALRDPPAIGYGIGDTITVTGRLAQAASRERLYNAVAAVAGDRTVQIETEILNETLCLIETALPSAPSGGIGVAFGFGDRPDTNESGRYFVGENPVIDIVLPADVTDGFLSVSILDVSGNVFHVLPNVNRPDHDIASLRAGRDGAVPVRVAFPLEEAATDRLAFTVDATTLGKSKVIALLSGAPLFDEMRPTTESAGGFAQALRRRSETGDVLLWSLDTRILTTAEP